MKIWGRACQAEGQRTKTLGQEQTWTFQNLTDWGAMRVGRVAQDEVRKELGAGLAGPCEVTARVDLILTAVKIIRE